MTHQTFQSAINDIKEDLADGSTQELAQYLAELMSDNAIEHQSGEGLREAFDTFLESLTDNIDLSAIDEDTLFNQSQDLIEAGKWWTSDDNQSSVGKWDLTTPDAEIIAELEAQGYELPSGNGRIEIG